HRPRWVHGCGRVCCGDESDPDELRAAAFPAGGLEQRGQAPAMAHGGGPCVSRGGKQRWPDVGPALRLDPGHGDAYHLQPADRSGKPVSLPPASAAIALVAAEVTRLTISARKSPARCVWLPVPTLRKDNPAA